MGKQKVVTIEDRIPKLKQRRKQKANRRLITYLSFFFLLLSGVLYFQSPLSKVSTITVKGNQYLTDEEIISLSGVKIGTSYWKVNKGEISKRIKRQHEEIQSVTIDKKLPNHISIGIKEYKRVAYVSQNGIFLPVIENGKIITTEELSLAPFDAPILLNWGKKGIKLMAAELSKVPPGISKMISEIHYTPKDYDPLQITLYMNDGYEVRATVRGFSKNITAYPSIISELDPNLKGYIELDVVPTFKPYEVENSSEEKEMDTDESEG